MSTPEEVKLQDKIQKLEMRMLGGDGKSKLQQLQQYQQHQQVSADIANSVHSNSHLGSAGSSGGGSGETHITSKDTQSHSLLFTKDLGNMDMAGGRDGSRENHDNTEGGGVKKEALNTAHVAQLLEHDVRSNHSGSLSRISPLKPSNPSTAAKGARSIVKESAMHKRKNPDGSDAVLRDLNSVLKHVPGAAADAGEERKEEDGGHSQPPEAKQPKLGNAHDNESTNGSASISIIGEKEGSRPSGAGGGRQKRTERTIASYFSAQRGDTGMGGGGGSSSSSSSSSGGGGGGENANRNAMRSPPTVGDDSISNLSSSTASVGGGLVRRGRAGKSAPSSSSTEDALSDRELRKQLEALKASKEQSSQKAFRLEMEMKDALDRQKLLEERNLKIINSLETANREMARQEGRRKRDRLALDCVRLGKIATMRTGPTQYGEVWEEGYALKELNRRSAEFVERREELQRRRSELTKAKAKAKKKEAGGAAGSGKIAVRDGDASNESSGTSGLGNSSYDNENDLDLIAESEAIQSHLNQLKKDEQALSEERKVLEAEKAAHQKELKRCQSEDRSRFYKDLPCLGRRYLLTALLGRGGFSEVWKALDLISLKQVAIKIHQLNPSWGEERKQSYIKHVTREYTIHRDMKHPRVVQLFDVFEIDTNCFATVLEYCRGIDLDEKLKRHRLLTEKDARTILLQILSGLRYLNVPGVAAGRDESSGGGAGREDDGSGVSDSKPRGQRRMAIIHYDLKPANILFDEFGDAKITDFGLSKIIDDSSEDESLELTSQGAGTYWYLPPECFARGDGNGGPRVSSKVDVWSVGVIFFQMLYGKRPFGEGKSQEIVLREGIMLNAKQVEFPSDSKAPKVSDEAKDFIRACLTHEKQHRPDVLQLCGHPYVTAKIR